MSKKFNFPTQAEKIFKNRQLILARPEGMSMDEYRALRKLQTRTIQSLFPKQFDIKLARAMQPRNRSEHQELMLKNALFLKYGKDITEETKENRQIISEPSFFARQFNKIRSVFGMKNY